MDITFQIKLHSRSKEKRSRSRTRSEFKEGAHCFQRVARLEIYLRESFLASVAFISMQPRRLLDLEISSSHRERRHVARNVCRRLEAPSHLWINELNAQVGFESVYSARLYIYVPTYIHTRMHTYTRDHACLSSWAARGKALEWSRQK